ncbi:hypothetical protein [Azospirillum halopraeferens]|uniref:hypothetical protein n=1 Tax=Azospirillum halopraeferens TaxID=34010 RepID=UPI00040C757A|nr:hypothetical protein [Azospirillum halopraeferens]
MDDPTLRPGITAATGPISRLEWAVAGLGCLLVAGVIGYLFYLAVFVPDEPPDIVASVQRVADTRTGYRIDIRTVNMGGTTAAEVKVEGTLSHRGQPVETGDATIDFVPPGSERTVSLTFRRDPRTHELDVRTVGFRTP